MQRRALLALVVLHACRGAQPAPTEAGVEAPAKSAAASPAAVSPASPSALAVSAEPEGPVQTATKTTEAAPPRGAPRAAKMPPGGPPNAGSPLGTNLALMRDYTGDWPFVDAFHQARYWISGSAAAFDDHRALALDDNGWVKSLEPGQIARALLFKRDGLEIPRGAYVVLYDGKGSLQYSNARRVESKPGREVIIPGGPGGFGVEITATNPQDHLRNIRVIMPGGVCAEDQFKACGAEAECGPSGPCLGFEQNYPAQIFHPTFLAGLKDFSTLRFMEWMNTNKPYSGEWKDRPRPETFSWAPIGVPAEIMVELANRLQATPWFNMPHIATDEYIRGFAKIVSERLDPRLPVYVEYSNEVWNGAFPQARFALETGQKRGLGSGREGGIAFYRQRSSETFELWRREFKKPGRVVRVLASQSGASDLAAKLLAVPKPRELADVLAIAPYFGYYLGTERAKSQVLASTPEQAFAELKGRALETAKKEMLANAAIAKRAGLTLVAYEGGQHLVGIGGVENDAAINQIFEGLNRDPRMKALYLEYLDAWREVGGGLFVHYAHCVAGSKYGYFGALERPTQARKDAPKYDALLSYIEAHRGPQQKP